MPRRVGVGRFVKAAIAAGALGVAALAWAPGAALGASSQTCSGTPENPGILAGDHWGDVNVQGICFVAGGPATVHGGIVVEPGSALVAAFALNHSTGAPTSRLTVTHNIRVMTGAAALLGCTPRSFPCLDDPKPNEPSLSSADVIGGNLIGADALGIIVHNSTIAGSVNEMGGGGGVSCAPSGVFAVFGQPPYSDYEDSTIDGNLVINGLHSCWLGAARLHVHGTARFLGVRLADRDGIEILANEISGNLACAGNSMVWDSAEALTTGALFPRIPEPNIVHGERTGQCVYASPSTENGPLGTTPF